MFIILLELSSNRDKASHFLEAHKNWLQSGFNDGMFLLAGSIEPRLGGAILAQATSLAEVERRVEADPFVVESVVSVRILEVRASRSDERLRFLLDRAS